MAGNKVDWSKSPEGAEFYANGSFYINELKPLLWSTVDSIWKPSIYSIEFLKKADDYEERPTQWPETDERINNIGLNRTEDDIGHYNELREAQSAQKAKAKSKYHRVIKGVEIDVYSVLKAYGVTCPAIAHAIKKLLLPGERHAKTWEQDINEAIASLERAKELRND
jgi:hypothetical protein